MTPDYATTPLAARMRPTKLENFFGQKHLLGSDKPLYKAIQSGQCHSMVLWGPPGSGKTTLAQILAQYANAHFEKISAVFAGVKDIRLAVEKAQQRLHYHQASILFIDEIHRFNKSQQDAFLPYVEDGTITLIGATTENPSFELNNALLSRARVYVLKRLSQNDLLEIIQLSLQDERGFAHVKIEFPIELQQTLAIAADGDARRCLNYLEILIQVADQNEDSIIITENLLNEVLSGNHRQFDKGGDLFYDQISALHKALRGSAPDAALYWFCRMLDGGCDPLYIARRLIRAASEDIGNADPRALTLILNATDAYERLGSPEGELAIAQALIYLCCAAKSNATYTAFKAAMRDAKENGTLEVPLHIRNAPTRLMKDLGHGKDYRYAHNEDKAYAAGENYFPEAMNPAQYYFPVTRGLETKIKEKLDYLKNLDKRQMAK